MDIILGILEQGLTYSFLALGLYIAYTILDFPDLTVDGSFPLGGAVAVSLIILGVNPILASILSFIAGTLAGVLTGFIHIKLGVKDLLAGLISQTALYTINILIAGKANVSLISDTTLFNNKITSASFAKNIGEFKVLLVMIPIVVILKFFLDRFLDTKRGFLLKATGDNETLVKTMGIDSGIIKIQGLALSNGLVALSGAIVVQEQRYFDLSMGQGAMVMGMASMVLGMKVLERVSILKDTTKVIIGSIIYKACISIAILIGFSANSMKLMTAIIFLAILVIGNKKDKRKLDIK